MIISSIKKAHLFEWAFTLCEPGRIRTFDRLLRREVLYPAELRAQFNGKFITENRREFNSLKKEFRRGGRIRTCDLLVPNEAR